MKRRDYSRKSANKQVEKKIVKILCEGKTERLYLKDLLRFLKFPHEHFQVLRLCGKTNPLGLCRAAEDVLRKGGCDIIYIIRDGDKRPHPLSKNPKIIEIISIPCFELWFLLHFSDGKKPFDKCNDVEGELKKYLTAYEKGQEGIFEKIKDGIEEAKKRASNLREVANSTNMHEFILTLEEEAKNMGVVNP